MNPSGHAGDDNDLLDVDERLQALLDAYGSFLRSAVRRLCPATLGVTVEEIEQDARIRLWHALRRERTIADPASYLYRIAATAAIDAVRRVRARRETQMDSTVVLDEHAAVLPIVSTDRTPEQLVVDQQVSDRIADAVARLADNRRRAVGLHLQGFTSTEIGQLLGWTEPKARNLTHRGLNDLRASLRSEGIDMPENSR